MAHYGFLSSRVDKAHLQPKERDEKEQTHPIKDLFNAQDMTLPPPSISQ